MLAAQMAASVNLGVRGTDRHVNSLNELKNIAVYDSRFLGDMKLKGIGPKPKMTKRKGKKIEK